MQWQIRYTMVYAAALGTRSTITQHLPVPYVRLIINFLPLVYLPYFPFHYGVAASPGSLSAG